MPPIPDAQISVVFDSFQEIDQYTHINLLVVVYQYVAHADNGFPAIY